MRIRRMSNIRGRFIKFGVRSSAFGVEREEFGVRSSAFGVEREEFGVRSSAIGVR
jgi:hypothetical protein